MIPVSRTEIDKIISDTVETFPHDACSTCECFLGLIVQLELDSDSNDKSLLSSYKPKPGEVHSCLGCDPCPPGDGYAAYLRSKN
jgi:hypothetical protein